MRTGLASAAGASRWQSTALGAALRAAGLRSPAGLSAGALPRVAVAAAAAARGYAGSGLPPHTELGMPALSPTMSQVWKRTSFPVINQGTWLHKRDRKVRSCLVFGLQA